MNSLHISQARKILDRGKPVNLRVVTSKGSIIEAQNVVSLRYDFYGGTRTIKWLLSGEIRTIRDVCIIGLDDFEVYL